MSPPASPFTSSGIRLLGFDGASGPELSAKAGLNHLTLYWSAPATPDANLLVSLRLVDSNRQTVWQSPGSVPVGGLYPTNAWRPGEIVSDYYQLPLDPQAAPGIYRLQAGLFPPFAVGAEGWAEIASFEVPISGQARQPSRPLRARFGDQWLLGYDLPETAAPGAAVPVTLYWLRGTAETVTAFGETRSVAAWPVGAIAPLRYDLTAPTTGAMLPVSVESGVLARCGWLAPATQACALPSVAIAGQAIAEGAINFGNLLVLREIDLNTTSAPAGGQVLVDLEWQGLQTIGDDYTVFVHLIGPDGLVHGQVDMWPVSGTRATSTWQPGEIILDPYFVQVSPEAPAGNYQVEVGLYLLATGERLRVLNSAGAPVDDRVLVPGLSISR
jgi:hypothetical protein